MKKDFSSDVNWFLLALDGSPINHQDRFPDSEEAIQVGVKIMMSYCGAVTIQYACFNVDEINRLVGTVDF